MVPIVPSSPAIPVPEAVSTDVAGDVPTRIPLSNLRNTPPIGPAGTARPAGSIIKGQKKGEILLNKGTL